MRALYRLLTPARTRAIALLATALGTFGIFSMPAALAQPATNISSMTIQQTIMMLQNSDAINFIQHANMAEVQAMKTALDKLQTPRLKEIAQIMMQDHQTSRQDVAKLAATLNIQISDFQAGSNEIATDNILDQLHGVQFEQAFLAAEKMDHLMAINTLQQLQKQNLDPQIQKLINDTLPVLQKHLAMLSG